MQGSKRETLVKKGLQSIYAAKGLLCFLGQCINPLSTERKMCKKKNVPVGVQQLVTGAVPLK